MADTAVVFGGVSNSVNIKAVDLLDGTYALKVSPIGGGSGGTVTSVAVTGSVIFNITGSPITTSGTIDVSLASQSANLVLASPSSGAAATPAFRSLVTGDIPDLSSIYASVTVANTWTQRQIFNGEVDINKAFVRGIQSFVIAGGTQTIVATSGSIIEVSGTTAGSTIKLPASPVVGMEYSISNSATVSFTLDGNGNNIDGSSTTTLSAGVGRNISYCTTNGWRTSNLTATQANALYGQLASNNNWTGTNTYTLSITAQGGIVASGANVSSLSTTSNTVGAITLNANGGTTETVLIRAQQGTGATSINLVSTAGGVTINASSAVAITNNATIGGTLGVTGLTSVVAITATGVLTVSTNGALSAPAITGTGTWITGGSGTTTKPYLLVEPTGTTSTGWSTSGTGIGVNAASGFAGNLLDIQVAGSSKFKVNQNGLGSFSNGVIVTGSGGSSFAGGVVSINASSNFAVNIATGTSNGTVAIGGGSGAVTITSTTLVVSTSSNTAGSLSLSANAGTSETVLLKSFQGTSATSVNIVSVAGGITINASSAVAVTNAMTVGKALTSGIGTTISGSGSTTLDFSTGNNFNCSSATGTITLANPSNVTLGQDIWIQITQDATGGRTVTFGANWQNPSSYQLTGTASKTQLIRAKVSMTSTSTIYVLAVSAEF